MRSKNIEKEIVNKLFPGAWQIKDLVNSISLELSASPQGVYKAIRKLRQEEVVSVYGKSIALSGIWIAKEKEHLIFAEETYKSVESFAELASGTKQRISFRFKTLNEVDLFWTHAFFQFAEQVDVSVPSYSIQPHDWYLYVRSETDSFWIEKHDEVGRLARTILTRNGLLDYCVMKERKKVLGKKFEFTLNENPLKQNNTTYYTILRPYIFKAEFDSKIANRLDSFVSRHDKLPLNEKAQKEISEIVEIKGKFKFSIEKNDKKAARMTNKCKKYFEF